MRKIICMLMTVLLLTAPVFAAEVDQFAVLSGMGKSWYQGYEPTVKNNTMTIYLPIQSELEGTVTVSIALTDPKVYLLTSQPKSVTVSKKDGIYPVKLTLSLQKDRRNGDYPAVITLKSGDKTETLPYTIRIRDGRGSHEDLSPVISDVSGNLDVGINGSLELTITNPTSTLSMMGGILTITDPTGEVLMTGSDRFPLPEILPGKAVTVSVPMTVLGNAAIRVHTLNLKLSSQVSSFPQTLHESLKFRVWTRMAAFASTVMGTDTVSASPGRTSGTINRSEPDISTSPVGSEIVRTPSVRERVEVGLEMVSSRLPFVPTSRFPDTFEITGERSSWLPRPSRIRMV